MVDPPQEDLLVCSGMEVVQVGASTSHRRPVLRRASVDMGMRSLKQAMCMHPVDI